MKHRIRVQMVAIALFLSFALFSSLASAASYSISPTSRSHTSSAGSNNFQLTATSTYFLDFCFYSVTSNAAWITITSEALGAGCGSHTVYYSYTANSTFLSRTGTITAGGKTYTVTQSGQPLVILPLTCLFPAYSISPSSRSVTSSATTGTVSVTDSDGCGWTAASNAAWIHVTAGASGTGNGTVSYSVDANVGLARTGTVTIGGKTFTVTQNAGLILCLAPSLTPTNQMFSANGGDGSLAVNYTSGCAWTAASNDPACIYSVSPTSGSGNGTVNYSVAGNSGTTSGSCTMTVAGQTFTVSLAGCTFVLDAPSASAGPGASTGTVAASANGWACNWSATSNAPSWITLTSAATGTGNTVVSYSLAANPGAARTGTVTIAGQTFTVTQGDAAPIAQAQAVEYYHAGFGHYFVTGNAGEAAGIDGGAVLGWTRTGQTYSVYSLSGAGLSPVCRFFTITFAPKSSHFYTPNAAECTLVKTNPNWQFEQNAFYVTEPAGGFCPAGTAPLYRIYNNGRSGAPNHRYTTCNTIHDNMISRGWVSEGVAMCVPAGSANCAIDNSGGGVNYNAAP